MYNPVHGCTTIHSSARKYNNVQAIRWPFQRPLTQEQRAQQNVCSAASGWIPVQQKPDTRVTQGSFSTRVRVPRKQTPGVGVAFLVTERSTCWGSVASLPHGRGLSHPLEAVVQERLGPPTQQGRLALGPLRASGPTGRGGPAAGGIGTRCQGRPVLWPQNGVRKMMLVARGGTGVPAGAFSLRAPGPRKTEAAQ